MAAHEIKTTLVAEGEQAFKRSINEARTSIRNLGTQLTLAQAEFKRDGDAMKLAETRAKTLKAEINQQKEIVRALEGAVKDAAKKFGEGSAESEKWEAELNRAKATMANLQRELSNNEQGLDRNGRAFVDASEKAGEFSDAVGSMHKGISFSMISDGIGKISGGFDTAIQKATELATKMWTMMRDAASWADDEATLASVYGISVEELQQMQYAAKLTDTDVDVMIKARQKLAKAMGSELNSKDMQEAFQAARVQVYDQTNGKMRALEEVFWDVGASLMAMDDEVLQNNTAMKLFGKSWMELRPLFNVGRDEYANILADAPIVEQEQIDRLTALQDQLDQMDSEFQALKMNVLSELAPAFEVLAGALTDLMSEFNAYLQTEEGQKMMADLRQAVTDFFSEIKKVDLQSAVDTVGGALGIIRDALTWISNNGQSVSDALGLIGGAFAGIKLAGLAANIGKIVAGITLLRGVNPKTPVTPTSPVSPVPTSVTGAERVGIMSRLGRFFSSTAGHVLGGSAAFLTTLLTPASGGGRADEFAGVTEDGKLILGNGEVIENKMWDSSMDEPVKTPIIERSGGVQLGIMPADYDKEAAEILAGVSAINDSPEAIMEKLATGLAEEAEPKLEEVYSDVFRLGPIAEPEEEIDPEAEARRRLEEFNAINDSPDALLDMFGTMYGWGDPTLYQTPAGPGSGEQLSKDDLEGFNALPDQMSQKVANAMRGIQVMMDRVAVGRMVAPVVSEMIASEVG